jgi:hypothetical protein
MGLTIAQKADTLGTFRSVLVRLMEILAAWVPTSPELEVKALFGRHIWQVAQLADAIGHRTVELRAKLHYDRPPIEAYQRVLQQASETTGSGNRVSIMYDVVLPDVQSKFETYLAQADQLLDAPSVDIVRRALLDLQRMQADRREFAVERPDVQPDATDALSEARRSLAACAEFVHHREDVSS